MADFSDRPALRVADLCKKFGARMALDRVGFTVGRGHATAVIGPSGSGKTTLLRCLAGLEAFEGGEVWLDGERFTPSHPRWFHANPNAPRIGLVFQDYNLWDTMTALDNLVLPLVRVKGLTRAVAIEHAARLAERFRLHRLLDRSPRRLSGGERQRFALLRAVLLEPKVLLLDEITSALDVEMRREVVEMLWDLSGASISMVVVSHDLEFLKAFCHTAIFLKDGLVCDQGPIERVLVEPRSPDLRAFLDRIQLPTRAALTPHQGPATLGRGDHCSIGVTEAS